MPQEIRDVRRILLSKMYCEAEINVKEKSVSITKNPMYYQHDWATRRENKEHEHVFKVFYYWEEDINQEGKEGKEGTKE